MRWVDRISGDRVGRFAAIAVAALLAFVAARSLYGFFGRTDAQAISTDRLFVCSETGKSFRHSVRRGETIPIHSPFSGQNTGYPAELCYWTRDGQIRKDPVAVLLKQDIGEPGPTFCPDCGRLVVAHNPFPTEGITPPPTKVEYAQRHRNSDADTSDEDLTADARH